jgi:hypothetical protein
LDVVVDGDQRGVDCLGLPEPRDEVKPQGRNRAKLAYDVLFGVAARESVGDCVGDADLYSTAKSRPRSLPTQWCCGMVASR